MLKLFKKDLKLFFKDKHSILLTFLLPIILISLFAFVFGGLGNSKGSSDPIELLVADLDQTTLSKEIVAKLDSLEGLKIITSDFEKSKKMVNEGKHIGSLVFHKGFEDSVSAGDDMPVELLYDKAQEMEIGMLQPVLISTLMSSTGKQTVTRNIESYLQKNFPNMDKSLSDKILSDAANDNNGISDFDSTSGLKMTSIVGEKEETNLGLIQAVAGTAIMMLLFSVAGLGTSILEEKENGTIKRLMTSPLKGSTILYGKMLFAFCIAILPLTIMFLFAWLAFKLDITENIPAYGLMIIATGFAASSFGVFLAAISKTRQQAQGLSTLIILVMSAIGGSMVPLFIMPAIMKKIAIFSIN